MFGDKMDNKLRRFSPYEMETEKDLCRIFHRPPRTYVQDLPFYPWLKPEPLVNQYKKYN